MDSEQNGIRKDLASTMNTPSFLQTFLNQTKPKNPNISGIPHGAAQTLETAANSIYALLTFAHQEIASIYQPVDARGSLIAWEGHEPLQLEGREDRYGHMHLLDIRCRGASVSEHLAEGLWDAAEAWLQEHHAPPPAPALSRRAAALERADERAA